MTRTPRLLNIADRASIEGYSFPTVVTSRLCLLAYGWHNYSSFLFSRSDAIPSLNLFKITRFWIAYLHLFFLKKRQTEPAYMPRWRVNRYLLYAVWLGSTEAQLLEVRLQISPLARAMCHMQNLSPWPRESLRKMCLLQGPARIV